MLEKHKVSSYSRIEFVITPDDVTAITALESLWLGERGDPLHPPVKWAAKVADEQPPDIYPGPEDLQEIIRDKGLPPLPMPRRRLRENVTIAADYVDSMAAQVSAGSLQYSQGPLYAFWRSTDSSLNARENLTEASTLELRSLDDQHELQSNLADAVSRSLGIAAFISAARSDARVRILASSSPGPSASSYWVRIFHGWGSPDLFSRQNR